VQWKACAIVWPLIAGCAVGAPPGFSSGDRWVFPLVGPLEEGLLITPVSINGHGPYLFAFDPDANITAIDKQVVEESGLRVGSGPHRIDETDTGQVRVYAEMLDLKVANLTIDRRDAMIFPVGLYDTEGRHLNGVLGRDVIADSLVFGFDRDHGIATLSTQGVFRPPPDAEAVTYQAVSSRSSAFVSNVAVEQAAARSGADLPDVTPVPRRLASARIGEGRFAMHLDLGAAVSQLPEVSWTRARLTPASIRLRLVDEAATSREVTRAAIGEVAVGKLTTASVTFVPFVERRFATEGVDGALGLDFFRPFAVYANWDKTTYYVKPRGAVAATTTSRLARWGADVPTCPHPGCITAEVAAGDAGWTLRVVRDAQATNHALEVFLGVTPGPGRSAPGLVVELPSETATLSAALSAEYAGAALTVLDVSPFPRVCPGDGGCVLEVGTPAMRSAEPGPMGPPPPRNFPIDKLVRVTGDPAIPPNADVQNAANGKPIGATIVKLCLTAEGRVESTKLVKSSGVAAYDEQVQATIKATWAFEPVTTDGNPGPVCTSVTFFTR